MDSRRAGTVNGATAEASHSCECTPFSGIRREACAERETENRKPGSATLCFAALQLDSNDDLAHYEIDQCLRGIPFAFRCAPIVAPIEHRRVVDAHALRQVRNDRSIVCNSKSCGPQAHNADSAFIPQ